MEWIQLFLIEMKGVALKLFGFILLICVVQATEGDCTNETFGTVADGETAYAGCPSTYDGYQSALCTSGVYGEADMTHCTARAVTVFSYGIAAVEFTKGHQIATLSLQTDGAISTFAISSDLPAGLVFSATDGSISGTPTTTSDETTYTITGGDSSTTLKITVSPVVCRALDSFPEVEDGQTSSAACPAGYTGTATRLCTDGSFGDINTSGCTLTAPASLSYTGSTTVRRGESIILTPSVSNTVTSWTSTALPAGIQLTTRGTIAGVPTAAAGTYAFTVTASNAGGSTTRAVSITVNAASCTGLENDSGVAVTTLSGQSLSLNCPDGYNGNALRQCVDGVYQDQLDMGCTAVRPTGFSYATTQFTVYTKVYMTTGRPSFSGIANYFSITPDLPEGFSLDQETGVISGYCNSTYTYTGTVSAKASADAINVATTSITINIVEPSCDATEDYSSVVVGSSSSYNCPSEEYDEGKMVRKCVREGDVAMWALPDTHCQKKQDYTFLIISVIILVVCLIILFIGCCVKSSRSRSKNVKTLKNTSKPAPKAAPKPAPKAAAAPKPKSAKVTI